MDNLHACREVRSLDCLGVVWVSTVSAEDIVKFSLHAFESCGIPHEEVESVGHYGRSGIGAGNDSGGTFHQSDRLVWLHGFKTVFIEL